MYTDGVHVFKHGQIEKLVDGTDMVPFESYKALALRPINLGKNVFGMDAGEIRIGDTVYVQSMPSGDIYIYQYKNNSTAILTGAKLGIDFEWTS